MKISLQKRALILIAFELFISVLFVIMTDLLMSNQTTYNSPRELVIPKVMEEVKADEVVEKSVPLNKPPNTIPDI